MKTLLQVLFFLVTASFANSQSNVRITMVNPLTHEVELTNMGDVSQNVATHYLCNFPDYEQLNGLVVVSGNLNLMAGASVTVIYPPCVGTDGETAYYINNTFASAAGMRDYMEWGSGGHTREALAVSVGFWFAGEFVPLDPGFDYIGTGTDHGADFWANQVSGCTYPMACNYDALATQEDGSCEFSSCAGCTFACALNYDPAATIEDGSCIGVGCVNDCPADFDGNNLVNTGDLLIFVAAFGSPCP
jgi:hypothetical protein